MFLLSAFFSKNDTGKLGLGVFIKGKDVSLPTFFFKKEPKIICFSIEFLKAEND